MNTIACILIAVISLASSASATGKTTQNGLIVYGENFSFTVSEPLGWHGDTRRAESFGANIVFYPGSETAEKSSALIRIRLNTKTDENTAADLKADMVGYRKQYPRVQFQKAVVSHPKYQVLSKLFVVPGTSYEYVVYLNPGRQVPYVFSASMNTQKSRAKPDQLAAFQQVVASISFLTANVKR